MAMNKFQRSRFTFDLSAKVAHIGDSHQHIKTVFSETTWPIELIFHMKTSYNSLAKIYTNCNGHMTRMATTPIYSKTPFNIFSGIKRPMVMGLGM